MSIERKALAASSAGAGAGLSRVGRAVLGRRRGGLEGEEGRGRGGIFR